MVSKGQFMGLDWNRIIINLSCVCFFIFNILTLEVGWLHLDML